MLLCTVNESSVHHSSCTITTVLLQDRRTDPDIRMEPATDAEQNWNLIAADQIGGFTTLEFSRLLDTGDAGGDRVIGPVHHCKLNPHHSNESLSARNTIIY